MSKNQKEWLVRTRAKEILGPYTQDELLVQLSAKTFTLDDEISASNQYWISASTLSHRDFDEITRTSTRNQTVSTTHPLNSELTPTNSISPVDNSANTQTTIPPGFSPLIAEELTPVPLEALEKSHPNLNSAPTQKSPLIALTTFLVVGSVLAGLLSLIGKPKPDNRPNLPQNNPALNHTESTSPFLKKIQALIDSGEPNTALRQLALHHEKHQGTDSEYLIPYASLLITEGESPQRAKKLLDQILSSQASPTLKSHAHHWLGYLMLSQDDGDMGESHFLEALQLNPKDAAARFNLGRAYLKQEKFSQALDYLQLAELEMPNLWLIHIYKGWARLALGNMEEARSSFKTAIQSSKERWMTYIYYSIFLMGLKEHEEAKTVLKQMLAYDPQYEIHAPPPQGFFQSKVNYSEYLKAYTSIMDKASHEEREMGKIYLTYLMNNSSATQEWRRMSHLADKGGGVWPRILSLKMQLDHSGDSNDLKATVTSLPPSLDSFGPYAYVLRGQARERLNQLTDAQLDYQRALGIDPKSSVSLWAHASLLKRLHRSNDARQEIDSLLSFHPNYIPAIVSSHQF